MHRFPNLYQVWLALEQLIDALYMSLVSHIATAARIFPEYSEWVQTLQGTRHNRPGCIQVTLDYSRWLTWEFNTFIQWVLCRGLLFWQRPQQKAVSLYYFRVNHQGATLTQPAYISVLLSKSWYTCFVNIQSVIVYLESDLQNILRQSCDLTRDI